MDFEKVELEKIVLADEQQMTLNLFHNRGVSYEGQVLRMDRIERGLVTGDAQWFLFNALRDRIIAQGQEIAELRDKLSKLEKPAKRRSKA